ncbi:MAG TPA: glyoxylate/hydroxypyruvate reductase A [Alphaproteobacteria bacterium]|nr:glyoxylate/hydroxypyruvate reductase A [Alphaproteobacteria bacterium]
MVKKAILFGSDFDDPAPFRAVLARDFPSCEFRVWPDAGRIEDIEYALIWKIDAGALRALPNLKAVLALGAGVDQILKDGTYPARVPLYRLLDAGLSAQMSEYAIYGVLNIHRRMDEYRAQQVQRKWQRLDAVHPSQRTVGVMGLGVLGADLARKLGILGFRTLGWSRTPKALPEVQCFHGEDGLRAFLSKCDIVVVLLPLTPQTQGIVNRTTLALLPPGAAIVNIARGRHVVDADLLAAIGSGHISHAMLDVFHDEPLPPDHPFWGHPRVFLTPHIAAQPIAELAMRQIIENLRRLENGEPPMGRVDLAAGY